ncbi:phosphotransferase [Devosia sp. YIM 151766]|uniref:phosphotransferase n=1 Tax=Devosia sp. YIM 151766 TaxID=3017325 RepID=UPI00255CF177|nr:phosphotransferase [Devosia sp. YIM 151766]WIY53256.1 phosphotransferase [Devosia sp. YIM 151766]
MTEAVIDALRRLHLVGDDEAVRLVPLVGGVSSDIMLAEVGERRFCVKRALPQLKVAADWRAPVERNAVEADYLRVVAAWQPGLVPEVLGEDRQAGLFAMAYLPEDTHPVWKRQLLDGVVDPGFAAQVGTALGRIHQLSAADAGIPAQFDNGDLFEALRLDPYLRATGKVHPDLAPAFEALAERVATTRKALMHGDVSPKNILVGPSGPVLLDAECGCFGDPAFDLAFLLNHLLLKATLFHRAPAPYLAAYTAIAEAYLAEVDWEDRAALAQRCADLLPALLLARIDGKSPVEYLADTADRDWLRQLARRLLIEPGATLSDLPAFWSQRHV